MCLYADKIVRRGYRAPKSQTLHSIPPDRQCRGGMEFTSTFMVESGCLSEEEADPSVWYGRRFVKLALENIGIHYNHVRYIYRI